MHVLYLVLLCRYWFCCANGAVMHFVALTSVAWTGKGCWSITCLALDSCQRSFNIVLLKTPDIDLVNVFWWTWISSNMDFSVVPLPDEDYTFERHFEEYRLQSIRKAYWTCKSCRTCRECCWYITQGTLLSHTAFLFIYCSSCQYALFGILIASSKAIQLKLLGGEWVLKYRIFIRCMFESYTSFTMK